MYRRGFVFCWLLLFSGGASCRSFGSLPTLANGAAAYGAAASLLISDMNPGLEFGVASKTLTDGLDSSPGAGVAEGFDSNEGAATAGLEPGPEEEAFLAPNAGVIVP